MHMIKGMNSKAKTEKMTWQQIETGEAKSRQVCKHDTKEHF